MSDADGWTEAGHSVLSRPADGHDPATAGAYDLLEIPQLHDAVTCNISIFRAAPFARVRRPRPPSKVYCKRSRSPRISKKRSKGGSTSSEARIEVHDIAEPRVRHLDLKRRVISSWNHHPGLPIHSLVILGARTTASSHHLLARDSCTTFRTPAKNDPILHACLR